jgi:hypothetical protein
MGPMTDIKTVAVVGAGIGRSHIAEGYLTIVVPLEVDEGEEEPN